MDTEINIDDMDADAPINLAELERVQSRATELLSFLNQEYRQEMLACRQSMDNYIRDVVPTRFPNPADAAREIREQYEEHMQFCREMIELAEEKQREMQQQHQAPLDIDQMGIEDITFNTPRYSSFGG